MAPKTLPDLDYLRECFELDANNGILRWRHRPRSHFKNENIYKVWNANFAGSLVGRQPNNRGYQVVCVSGSNFLVHRIIWKLLYGTEPPPQLDHRNLNRSSNNPLNLRVATKSQSACNKSRQKNNTSGFKGVSRSRDRWVAQIDKDGARFFLGRFDTAEEAYAVYCNAARQLHGEFARTE